MSLVWVGFWFSCNVTVVGCGVLCFGCTLGVCVCVCVSLGLESCLCFCLFVEVIRSGGGL